MWSHGTTYAVESADPGRTRPSPPSCLFLNADRRRRVAHTFYRSSASPSRRGALAVATTTTRKLMAVRAATIACRRPDDWRVRFCAHVPAPSAVSTRLPEIFVSSHMFTAHVSAARLTDTSAEDDLTNIIATSTRDYNSWFSSIYTRDNRSDVNMSAVCMYYLRGSCRFGNRCWNSHDLSSLRSASPTLNGNRLGGIHSVLHTKFPCSHLFIFIFHRIRRPHSPNIILVSAVIILINNY